MDAKLVKQIRYVNKGVLIFDIIVVILLQLTSNLNKPMLLGLIFGSLIALLNFRLLAIALEKTVNLPVRKAQIYSSSRYLIRMTIIFIVLMVSATASHLNLLGTVIGLLGPKFVILSKTVLIDKLKRKEA
ncbi:ATP synthase subunit I [Asaccharospora irregularis]|uniref:ATP synthase I chain n=1 Tax=Asaccharospora irregularis DSM 2635 TaxID=1121321 RepID=A0A1M5S950_9FIRM|nr:ATP synthase subunit I [Asaccharospora irregularis]SHH34970.1 ATP synthase I chain [Asaccharospora irregularis DSM 2635]